jgi:phosphoserine phosphatase
MTRNLTLFDLDGTLIPGDSDHAFGEFMVTIGWADGAAWRARNDEFFAQYTAGRLDVAEYVDFATSVWRRRPHAELDAAQARFMAEVIGPTIHPQALELVRAHQRAGDLVARPDGRGHRHDPRHAQLSRGQGRARRAMARGAVGRLGRLRAHQRLQ